MFWPQHFPQRGSQYLWYDIMQIKISWDIYPKGYWSYKMFYLPLRGWIETNRVCFIYWIKRITLSYRAHTVILKDIQEILTLQNFKILLMFLKFPFWCQTWILRILVTLNVACVLHLCRKTKELFHIFSQKRKELCEKDIFGTFPAKMPST